VRPPNGGRNEANSWETGSEYSSGETYTAAAMRAAGPGAGPQAGAGLRARAACRPALAPARWDIPTS